MEVVRQGVHIGNIAMLGFCGTRCQQQGNGDDDYRHEGRESHDRYLSGERGWGVTSVCIDATSAKPALHHSRYRVRRGRRSIPVEGRCVGAVVPIVKLGSVRAFQFT